MKEKVQQDAADTRTPDESTIESLLHSVSDDVNDEGGVELLSRWLSTEIQVKNQAGESVSADDYKQRFPGFEKTIEHAFDQSGNALPSRYRQTALHRAGGLGEVWRAKDVSLNREVALKRLKAGVPTSTEARRRFLREALITARLQHPNIVPIHSLEAVTADGDPYYTMRFVTGKTLREEIESFHASKFSPSGLRTLLTAFLSVCNAVRFAHAEHIIHRDLKPDNVLVGEYGEVILLDWGLAKHVDDEDDSEAPAGLVADALLTQAGVYLGTPAYSAPEQMDAASETDTKTDVYGLGAILYEILTGQPPTPEGIERKDEVSSAHVVHSRAPRPLSAIAAKALRLDPSQRFTDVLALMQDVEAWLADEPVSAYQDRLIDKSARWVRKHRRTALAGLVTTTLVALVAAAAAFGINEQRKDLERRVYAQKVYRSSEYINAGRFETGQLLLDECPDHLREWAWGHARSSANQVVAYYTLPEFMDSANMFCAMRYMPDGSLVLGTQGRDPLLGHTEPGGATVIWDRDNTFTDSRLTPVGNSRVFVGPGNGRGPSNIHVLDTATGQTVDELPVAHEVTATSRTGLTAILYDYSSYPGIASVWSDGKVTKLNQQDVADIVVSDELIVGCSVGPQDTSEQQGPTTQVNFWRPGESEAFNAVTVSGVANSCHLSDDGKLLAFREPRGVAVFDISNASQPSFLTGFIVDQRSPSVHMSFSPDNEFLAIAETGRVVVRRIESTGRTNPYSRLLLPNSGSWSAHQIEFSPDGGELAILNSRDVLVWDWDHKSRSRTKLFSFAAEDVVVDNEVILAAGMEDTTNGQVVTVDITTGERQTISTHEGIPAFVDLNERKLVYSFQNRIQVHDRETTDSFELLHGDWADYTMDVNAESYNPTAYRVSLSNTDLLATVATDIMFHEGRQATMNEYLKGRTSPDRKTRTTVAPFVMKVRDPSHNTILLWDLATRKPQAELNGHDLLVMDLQFTEAGDRLLSASLDSTIRVWDTSSGDVDRVFDGHESGVFSIALSPGHRVAASGDQNGRVLVWDIDTGEQLAALYGHTSPVHSLAFSKDGDRLASAHLGPGIIVWDMESKQRILSVDTYDSWPRSVGFTPQDDLYCIADNRELWTWKSIPPREFVKRELADEITIYQIHLLPE